MVRDTSIIKEKILQSLNTRGPSLPVHIAKDIQMDMIFASAFLSELLKDQKIRISNMRVGTSPIYYIQNQFADLEKYSDYLKSKEKEAYNLLKENKFLIDEEQEPAIKVALRSIKDFAKNFQHNNKIIWRYFLNTENEYHEKNAPKIIEQTNKETEPSKQNIQEKPKEEIKNNTENSKQPEQETNTNETNNKEKETKIPKNKPTKKKTSSKNQDKKNEKFFNTVKEHLTKNQIEITDIIGFSKDHLTLKIKQNNQELLLVSYNKKRITEADILNAFKKSQEFNMPYKIFSMGEPAKKITTLIQAIKNLESINKIE